MSTPQLPVTFANLPIGLNPLVLLDEQFAALQNGANLIDASTPVGKLIDGATGLPLVGNGGAGPTYRALPIAGGGTQTPAGSLAIQTTAGPFTITTEDWLVLNKGSASATSIVLPAVASRAGRPLRITDWGGNAGDITITPNGAETIMGLTSAVLGSGGQGIGTAASVTLSPSTDLSGWLVS